MTVENEKKVRLFDAVFLSNYSSDELWCRQAWCKDNDVKSFMFSIAYELEPCMPCMMIYSCDCNGLVDDVIASIEGLAEMSSFTLKKDWFLMNRLPSSMQVAMKCVFLDECLKLARSGRYVGLASECLMKPYTTLESLKIECDLLDAVEMKHGR